MLGERFSEWVKKYYQGSDRSFILEAALLDWACMETLIAPHRPSLNLSEMIQKDPECLLTTPFFLQPHLALFHWDYQLITFREECLKRAPDDCINDQFPSLDKEKSVNLVLYRNSQNFLNWVEMSRGEFLLLEKFKEGASMSEACEYIESQDSSLYNDVAEHLDRWLQNWVQAGWLCT